MYELDVENDKLVRQSKVTLNFVEHGSSHLIHPVDRHGQFAGGNRARFRATKRQYLNRSTEESDQYKSDISNTNVVAA